MKRQTFDLISRIILTLLALLVVIVIFSLQWPGRSNVLAVIDGILYLISAVAFWFADRQGWVRVVLISTLVATLFLSIAQALAGIPLGVYRGSGIVISCLSVLLVSPAILGLIYYNLKINHSNLELLLVFMRLVLNLELALFALILFVMLEISGALIWSLPGWGQYLFVYGMVLLVILDLVYAIINWFDFYCGKVTWITTSLVAIEMLICLPMMGMPIVNVVIFILLGIVILFFTAWLNNYVKNKK